MSVSRRTFLGRTAGVFASFGGLQAFTHLTVLSHRSIHGAPLGQGGYGPLEPSGPHLALPEGFHYTRLGVTGTRMDDGFTTPQAPDGMGAFPLPNGNIRLIRNHELMGRFTADPPFRKPFDVLAGGGTTSLEIHPETRELVSAYRTLEGTTRNCAGGVTPWGSWLSCEEATAGREYGLARSHGYVFEVPASTTDPVEPVPLRDMGRFVHEAVAVDPQTSIVYETEDQTRGGFYRFIPHRPATSDRPAAELTAGGRLQMLGIRGQRRYDTSRRQQVGVDLPVVWVDIPEPDPHDAEEHPDAVFRQGWQEGGARFSRVEGCFYSDGSIYFSSTDGGNARQGQIWEYRPTEPEGGVLRLLFESPHSAVLQKPDNLCASPRGGVLICEDGSAPNHLRGLTPEGRVFDFARNTIGTGEGEFAGATFSPDGRTLFVNIQRDPGATFAIWGPWERGAL